MGEIGPVTVTKALPNISSPIAISGDAVILVSGNEPGLAEGMLIAEIASRERRPGHFILRASKVISHSDWTGTQNYYLLFRSPPEVSQALGTIPVNVVVVDYPATPQSPPHHRLLLNSIQKNPGQWNLLYTGTDAAAQGGARQILVFQAPNIGSKNDIKLKLDLTETLAVLETTDH